MKNNLTTAFFTYCLLIFAFSACSKEVKTPEKKDEIADATPTPAHILKDYALVWNDEFEGTALDLTKWNYRQDGGVRKLGTVSKDAISLDGEGNMLITVTKGSDGIYYIGQISTDGLFSTKYGYFECRVKMQRSIGPHTAFWLQSPTYGRTVGNPDKDGVEIDIFEYHRKAPNKIYHNLHWDGYEDDHKSHGYNMTLSTAGEGFHTFGLEWTEDEYTFYVNGKKSWSTKRAVSQTEQYIILSSELSGWGGEPSEGRFPDAVTFDYVRVYKKK